MTNISTILCAATSVLVLESLACGQANSSLPVLNIDAGKVTAHVSPTLYGLMTEEINYSYEGGIYGELIQNRIFRDNAQMAKHWSVVQDNGAGTATIALDESQPIDGTVLTRSLKLDASKASLGHRIGVANHG
jgi:alpha-N-arabinofuranosidase